MSEIKILPPLDAGDKNLPHQKRRDEVFKALDEAASLGIKTYDELIDFVREHTGVGCSRKLVSKWKKERNTDDNSPIVAASVEAEPAVNDLQTVEETVPPKQQLIPKLSLHKLLLLSPRKLFVGVAAVGTLLVVMLQAKPTLGDRSLTIATQSQTTAPLTPNPSPNLPKQLKFSLSVSSPTDLKVKQGDTVEAGQAIAERREERDRLEAERNSLNLQYQQIQSRTIPKPPAPAAVPAVRTLPPISYAEEEAAIRAAETNVRQAERAFGLQQQSLRQAPLEESNAVERAAIEVENRQRIVDNQKRKIDAVKLLKDLPPSVMEHETEALKAKVAELKQATADQEQAQAVVSQKVG